MESIVGVAIIVVLALWEWRSRRKEALEARRIVKPIIHRAATPTDVSSKPTIEPNAARDEKDESS